MPFINGIPNSSRWSNQHDTYSNDIVLRMTRIRRYYGLLFFRVCTTACHLSGQVGNFILNVSSFSVSQSWTSESSLFSVSFTRVLMMGIEYSIVLNRSVSSENDIHLIMSWYIFRIIMYCDLFLHAEFCLLDNCCTSQTQHPIFHNFVICTEWFRESGCRTPLINP